MISAVELEKVREINRKLPFAHPIEQGDVPKARFFFAPVESISDPPSVNDIAMWTEITHAFVPESFSFT